MEELFVRNQHLTRSELHKKCMKESLQAVSSLNQKILAEAMLSNLNSPVLHRHLAEHERFAKDLCRLCYARQ